MKVSIGSKIVEGPWGGGNLFAKNLSKYLLDRGHEVVYDLASKDIDVILLTDPRNRRSSSSTFNHKDIKRYLRYVNPNSLVIQRINECDERKGTDNINQFYKNASEVSDHIVFVSDWLKRIYTRMGINSSKCSVIMAGANSEIFYPPKENRDNSKFRLVTHHWSSHWNKGFDTYLFIDKLLESDYWKEKIEFTYIGNLDEDIIFKNTNVIHPLSGDELANEIRKNDIYITASINEPSGNHHIEAAQCGLPTLFINSGGIPEYCSGFGEDFENNIDFEKKLIKIVEDFKSYKIKMEEYPFNSEKMCEDFYNLFNSLYEKNINFDKPKLNFIFKEIVLISTVFLNHFTDLMNRLKIFTIINVIKR